MESCLVFGADSIFGRNTKMVTNSVHLAPTIFLSFLSLRKKHGLRRLLHEAMSGMDRIGGISGWGEVQHTLWCF